MKLIDETLEALRTGDVIRVPVPELGGDVLLVLAMPGETTEQVLEETLEDLRVEKGLTQYARKVVAQAVRDDQAG